jgi:hypothetical protein
MVLAGVGRRQCVVEHDRAVERAGERARSFLPVKVLASEHLLRFRALRRGLGNPSIFAPWAGAQAAGCELSCSDSGRTKAQAHHRSKCHPKVSVVIHS